MDILRENPIPLRGGAETFDPRLDRVVQFDPRSRNYPIRPELDSDQPQTRWWRHTAKLDQGKEGACVGFAWAHELDSAPVEVPGMTDDFAQRLYRRAQQLDEWPGEDYSGTSVIAGAKAVQELHYLDEYRWAFGVEDVILTLSHHGPVILGVNWYYDMYFPDGNQYIRPTGRRVGGHAIMALAYSHEAREIWLLNSWGPNWGWGGLCRIKVTDVDRLLREDGEACVPVIRGEGTPPEPEPEQPQGTFHSLGGTVNVKETDVTVSSDAVDLEDAEDEDDEEDEPDDGRRNLRKKWFGL